MTDEEIAEWTSRNDVMAFADDGIGARENMIPLHLVTAKLREMRDHAAKLEAELATLRQTYESACILNGHYAARIAALEAVRDELQDARTQWPSGAQAAEQLADAMRHVDTYGVDTAAREGVAESDAPLHPARAAFPCDEGAPTVTPQEFAAAVLAALAQEPTPE